jgi:hypothetical protein
MEISVAVFVLLLILPEIARLDFRTRTLISFLYKNGTSMRLCHAKMAVSPASRLHWCIKADLRMSA